MNSLSTIQFTLNPWITLEHITFLIKCLGELLFPRMTSERYITIGNNCFLQITYYLKSLYQVSNMFDTWLLSILNIFSRPSYQQILRKLHPNIFGIFACCIYLHYSSRTKFSLVDLLQHWLIPMTPIYNPLNFMELQWLGGISLGTSPLLYTEIGAETSVTLIFFNIGISILLRY